MLKTIRKCCRKTAVIKEQSVQSTTDFTVIKFGSNFAIKWQYQDTNPDWKFLHLPQLVFSNLAHSVCKMSRNLEGYNFMNGQISWDLKEGMSSTLINVSSDLMNSLGHKGTNNSYNSNEACLVLRIPPENRFRYRYDTEMSGTHGSLQGVRTGREKSVPAVELINYPFEALIRVTLVTCHHNEHYPHPHSLFVKGKLYQKKIYENWDGKCLTKTGHFSDPHYIRVGRSKNDYTARFEGMCIINSKKENFHSSVREKLLKQCFNFKHDSLNSDESENLNRRVETAVSAVDVDFVCLCFEAFGEEDGKLFPICQPIYSEPIGNAKSAKTGKLKISRINKCSGSCKGGDEIWLLVEKINKKGLIIRFSEECDGKIIWQSSIEGDDLILHHQYAIIFKTPPYRDVNIMSEMEVLMRLERTTQSNQPCDYSEPITFVYEPSKSKINKNDNLYRKESILAPFRRLQGKRPRIESSSASPISHQNKRRTNDLELEDMALEEFDDEIEELLFDSKDNFELEKPWGKLNIEEFLRFVSSDDVDLPLQRHGVAQNNKLRRDFFYKLYLLYLKLDENDIKKLIDQISDVRVSKTEEVSESKGLEKDQVKDAASTLLTLRSKAMINRNSGINEGDNLAMNFVSCRNKSDFSEQDYPDNKTESLNSVLESHCEPFEVQNSVHMSVIKFNLSSFPNSTKTGENLNDSGIDNKGAIKEEKNLLDCLMRVEKMENICRILNKNDSWRHLAELWNCTSAVLLAEKSSNPTKFILEYLKQIQGTFELDTLRNSLIAINEQESLNIFNEILSENFST